MALWLEINPHLLLLNKIITNIIVVILFFSLFELAKNLDFVKLAPKKFEFFF